MVNDAEGRDSMDSDLDLVNAGAGYIGATLPSVSSRLKIGSDGSSLPGRYMLSSKGRNPSSSGSKGRSNFRKSEGAPMVGRRLTVCREKLA
jgi:hypothetical protein